MLLNLRSYMGKYIFFNWLGVLIAISILLITPYRSLGGNEYLSIASVFFITWAVSFAVMRDQPGYWIYAVLSMKFMVDRKDLNNIRSLTFKKKILLLSPINKPYVFPTLISTVCVFLYSSIDFIVLSEELTFIIVMIMLFPILLCLQLFGAISYFVILASPEGEGLYLHGTDKKRSLRVYLLEDMVLFSILLFVLNINLNFIYDDKVFLKVHDQIFYLTISGAISVFLVFLAGSRRRLMTHVGERLSQLFLVDLGEDEPCLIDCLPTKRIAIYFVSLFMAEVLFLFSFYLAEEELTACILVWLNSPILILIYYIERRISYRLDMREANNYIEDFNVMPASYPRKTILRD